MKFTYTCYCPSLKENVEIYELDNSLYLPLVKCITSDSNLLLERYFTKLVEELIVDKSVLNYIRCQDYFNIALMIRCVNISPLLTLSSVHNKNQINFDCNLLDIIDRMSEMCDFKKTEYIIEINGSKIFFNLNSPKVFTLSQDAYNFIESIECVTNKNVQLYTGTDIQSILEILPAKSIECVFKFIQKLNELSEVSLISVPFNKSLNTHFKFDDSLIDFLKICYSADLLQLYTDQFHFIHTLKSSHDHYMKSTPNEVKTFIKIYKEMIQSRDKGEENNNNNINPLDPQLNS
jgi:hypothetical protein